MESRDVSRDPIVENCDKDLSMRKLLALLRRALILLVTNSISFVLGIAIALGTIVFLEDFFKQSVSIGGTLEKEEHSPLDASASGLPPEGFYIASRDRFYIGAPRAKNIANLGQPIYARGTLGVVCGPGKGVCFPKLNRAEVFNRSREGR